MVNPLVIRALVDCLVERQEVPNREQAFHYLADKGLASYYTVRSFYYRGRQDSRWLTLSVANRSAIRLDGGG